MAENFLAKEVAGQPVGVWAVVVAGGLGIAYVLNKGQSDSNGSREPLIEPGVGTGLVPAGAGFQTGNGNGDDTDDEPANNLQWGNEAKNWLVGQGHNATTVDRAVNKYLEGQQLSSQEDALLSQAISQLGAPPEGSISADPPEQEPEPGGSPELKLTDVPSTVPMGESRKLWGLALVGGKPPAIPGLVRVTEFRGDQPNVVHRAYFTPVSDRGSFSTRLWFNRRGPRRISFVWRGQSATRTIRVI